MEEGYELDLTYITERIIAVSFPRGCQEEIYTHNLKDVTRMLKSKHADNYLIINLSEKRHDLTRMNPKTLDTGWPDMHAPPLDKICTICKAMESWLNADPLHVVVIHCRGGKGRIGVVISSFVNFTDVSASADQALDRFAMRKYYDDKVSALMTPSQKRYVWILNSLLSRSMKINTSPLFLHYIILHGIPNFDSSGVCQPYVKVYQGMQAVYSSGIYHIGQGHRGRICVTLEPAQLLKGDIMIKCYHKSEVSSEREVIFRLQFHTGAVQGYKLMFDKEDMEEANKDLRFPEYGKVELVFSEGPEKISGADRWHNGVDVTVDYNTADPLIRWDSYQNMCDTEAPRSQGLSQDKASIKKITNGGETTLGRGACTTSATSSPDHSDHALSVSSDSGLSSNSLWADRPTPSTTTVTSVTVRSNQGPSQQEKVQLKRLLSGFGVEDPSLEEMEDPAPSVGIHQTVPAQVHINGGPSRGPQERETDILDDEIITGGQDLQSVDSFGTLSSCCHKSSQNSLLSDGFGSPGGEEQQSQTLLNHLTPSHMEDYQRHYAETRRGHIGSVNNSVTPSNPSSASVPKQHVYRQGSYSTQSWVRQQQMVAAQQLIYMPEDGNDTERYQGNKEINKEVQTLEQQESETNSSDNNKRDDEFKSLTMDFDNSIVQLNKLIMDLDATFMPPSNQNSSIKRNSSTHVNSSTSKGTNGIVLRFSEDNAQTMAVQPNEGDVSSRLSRQGSEIKDHPTFCSTGWTAPDEYRSQRTYSPSLLQSQHMLCRSDSTDYKVQGPETDSGVEAGCEMTPPTPAFPISPPTPYVKNMLEFSQSFRQTSPPSIHYAGFRTDHESHGYPEMVNHAGVAQNTTHSVSIVGSHNQAHSPLVNQSWAEHPVLSHQASSSSLLSNRQTPQHSMSLDYGHQPVHPVPNSHSSPLNSQRSRLARYALSHSPAQSFDEQDDLGLGYGSHCPTTTLLLGNETMERLILTSLDGNQSQPPHLPEKKRVSDGEHGGTASPALSGFSSPHSGSSLSIPFPNVLPDLSIHMPRTGSPLPDVLISKQVTVKFVQDTSKFWYKPDISRDQAISVLKDKEPGCFIVRDSHSFKGAYGLAMKVATPPPSVLQQSKKGGDLANELVRHFLIECTQKGVRLKGCPTEPYFGSLTALVCQHSITPLALPCKLIIPDRDPLEDVVDNAPQSVTNSAAELLKQGAACNVWYLGSVDMESLTGVQAVQKAASLTLCSNPPPNSTVVHFKVSSQGITLTDNQRKLFFRRHYNVNTVIFCALDPQDRRWKRDGCTSAKIFGFVARKTGTSTDNVCHLFAEHDPEQPASAIVNFVSKVMIGSHKSK
ncbi:tensin-3 [Stigmatopora argus]